MPEEAQLRCKIIFRGEFVGSMSQEDVGRNLRERLKFSETDLRRLFSGKPVTLKKNLDEATANRYAQALWAAGARCTIEPMTGPPPSEPGRPVPRPEPDAPAAMICPRCRQGQPEAEVCNRCGVVMAEARPLQEETIGAALREDALAPQPAATTLPGSGMESRFSSPGGLLTRRVIQAMVGTRPWVRLVAILMILGTTLGTGLSLFALFVGPDRDPAFAAPAALVQLLFCALWLIPAVCLFRYASAIGEFLRTGTVAELEKALERQKSFWIFVGVLTSILVGLALLGIAAALLVPPLMGRP